MEGFLHIDKPAGITSHGVVARVRRATKVKRVGHSGTLDPFATGLLIVGVGRGATKHLGGFLGQAKTYEAVAVLGATSDTQDKDGTIVPVEGATMPTMADIQAMLPRFTGELMQTPPMYSAKKIAGKKLYELAREGKTVERAAVPVTIYELAMLSYSAVSDGPHAPRFSFRVRCSAGTYVRTLAHDIAAALGTGAYLEELRRTAIGEVRVDDAVALDAVTPENWESLLKPVVVEGK